MHAANRTLTCENHHKLGPFRLLKAAHLLRHREITVLLKAVVPSDQGDLKIHSLLRLAKFKWQYDKTLTT